VRKLALLFSIVALPLVLAAAATANSTHSTTFNFEVTIRISDVCAFPVDFHGEGWGRDTRYFDNSGTLVKEIFTPFGGAIVGSAINVQTGKSLSSEGATNTEIAIFTFNPDGSIASFRESGLFLRFNVPGGGAILLVVGHVVHAPDGSLTFVAGRQDLIEGNTADFCNYLASP
jgi:hypothetical protein